MTGLIEESLKSYSKVNQKLFKNYSELTGSQRVKGQKNGDNGEMTSSRVAKR